MNGGSALRDKTVRIDLKKLVIFILKRIWLPVLCGIIGFCGMYGYTKYGKADTYSAYATMYVLNGNPNLVNYQYTNSNDLNSALQLLDTYMVVVRSNKVMNVVAERLSADYPGITPQYIAGTLSMGSVSDTGVLRVVCTTGDPNLSADICNAVLDVAPAEIIRVVSAGSIEIIDYAEVPRQPDGRNPMRKGMIGGLAGAVLAGTLLVILFLTDHKVSRTEDLTDNFTVPVLASVKRQKKNTGDPSDYLISNKNTPPEILECYSKLRMNLMFMLVGKDKRIIEITSSISGEGKTTVAANLAYSCAMSGKSVLLIDGDMRRACMRDVFGYGQRAPGLSNVLAGESGWRNVLVRTESDKLDVMPAGRIPPNPAELLGSERMSALLVEAQRKYDYVFIDVPPNNIVADPLVLSRQVTGCLFVVRQNYSDLREIRKALVAADLADMNVLGLVFTGEHLGEGRYYGRKYYRQYGSNYATQKRQKGAGSNEKG